MNKFPGWGRAGPLDVPRNPKGESAEANFKSVSMGNSSTFDKGGDGSATRRPGLMLGPGRKLPKMSIEQERMSAGSREKPQKGLKLAWKLVDPKGNRGGVGVSKFVQGKDGGEEKGTSVRKAQKKEPGRGTRKTGKARQAEPQRPWRTTARPVKRRKKRQAKLNSTFPPSKSEIKKTNAMEVDFHSHRGNSQMRGRGAENMGEVARRGLEGKIGDGRDHKGGGGNCLRLRGDRPMDGNEIEVVSGDENHWGGGGAPGETNSNVGQKSQARPQEGACCSAVRTRRQNPTRQKLAQPEGKLSRDHENGDRKRVKVPIESATQEPKRSQKLSLKLGSPLEKRTFAGLDGERDASGKELFGELEKTPSSAVKGRKRRERLVFMGSRGQK